MIKDAHSMYMYTIKEMQPSMIILNILFVPNPFHVPLCVAWAYNKTWDVKVVALNHSELTPNNEP
jgi:hypothetical protein